jgi:hypothetical protein
MMPFVSNSGVIDHSKAFFRTGASPRTGNLRAL